MLNRCRALSYSTETISNLVRTLIDNKKSNYFSSKIFRFYGIRKLDDFINAYRNLAAIPTPSTAVLLPQAEENTVLISSLWSANDVDRSERVKIGRYHVCQLKESGFKVLSSCPSFDATSGCTIAISKSGTKTAILRTKQTNLQKCQYIEIWGEIKKKLTIDVQDIKEHGQIYDDDQFGCFQWSDDETKLLYVAEKKLPKFESFFKRTAVNKSSSTSEDGSGEEQPKVGEKYLYRENWGETLSGKHHSVFCVADVSTGLVDVLSIPELDDVTVGQAVWGKNDESIVFVGWYENPQRLGIIFCANRRSAIYSYSLSTKKLSLVSGDKRSVRSPCFNSDKSVLIYLENDVGGPHRSCSKLIKCDWETKKLSTVLDIVENPSVEEFPGIYTTKLPERCWSKDGKYIFFSSIWRSKVAMLCVDVRNGHVERLPVDISVGSCSILDVHNDIIIASASAPNIEPYLMISQLSWIEDKIKVSWTPIDVPTKIRDIGWSTIVLEPPGDLQYEAILLTPGATDSSVPLIVWPHGGPHSSFVAGFQLFAAAFASLGFAVCLVNYRGSLGFGDASLKSLLGNVGVQDVEDVQFAVEHVKTLLEIGDKVIFGGSHGGFLAAHLSGQYPDYYKACICRNPVIDISGMVGSTDIPDWCWVESGYGDDFKLSITPTPQILAKMWEKSPIRYVQNVTVPTLILLGKKDLRVPPSQGLKYYHLLKARDVPVRLFMYDDGHSLSKDDADSDNFMQTAVWLLKYLSE